MEVQDEFIPEDQFATIIDAVPQVCVEVLLEGEDGVLVARRTNDPARGEWFWPGGRLYKGEQLEDAACRVAREELGIEVDIVEQVGVYSHFWDIASIEGADSRHTVNVVFLVRKRDPNVEIALDDQHDDYRFVTGDEDGLHEYVQRYLADL